MQRVKDVVFALIATRMTGEQIRLMENLHMKGIGFDHQRAASFLDRNRIAVRFVDDLAVRSQAGLTSHTASEPARGKRTQQRAFFLPGLSNTHFLSMHDPDIVSLTLTEQIPIQLFKGGDLWNGNHEVPARESHTVFHATFLMSLTRCAKMAAEQIIATKGDEGTLLLSD